MIFGVLFLGLVAYAAFRDIQVSSRIGLVMETISIGIIIVITAIVVGKHGTVIDHKQLDISNLKFGGVKTAMAFAVFSFVGFESAATLAKESSNPRRNVPLAVIGSAFVAGIFFCVMAYFMVLGMDDNAGAIGGSASPFADMTNKAGLPWAAGVVYFAAMISAFACALACINASSRMLYSMGRYQFLHRSMGLVHATHKTPHMAVMLSAAIVLVLFLALLPQGLLNGFGLTGTIATYGFVVVLFGRLPQHAGGSLSRRGHEDPARHLRRGRGGDDGLRHLCQPGGPTPPTPYNLLPPVFIGFLVIGLHLVRGAQEQVARNSAADRRRHGGVKPLRQDTEKGAARPLFCGRRYSPLPPETRSDSPATPTSDKHMTDRRAE